MIVTTKVVERADELGEKIIDWIDMDFIRLIEESKEVRIEERLGRWMSNEDTALLIEKLTGDHLDHLITDEAKNKIMGIKV